MDEVILSRIRKEAYEQGFVDGKVEGYNLAAKHISPQRKKGKWVYDNLNDGNGIVYHCDRCNWLSKIKYAYCPNCGAEMTGGDSSCTL